MTLGIVILIIVIFNHSNFSASLYFERIHELSLKKIMGVTNIQLTKQLILESGIIAAVATLSSLTVFIFLLPTINLTTGKNFTFLNLIDEKPVAILITTFLLIVIAGNFYPIFVSLKSASMRRLKQFSKMGSNRLRKVLIAIQLVFTTGLVFFTLTVHNQVEFLKNRDMGFNANKVVMVSLPQEISNERQIAQLVDDLHRNSSNIKLSLINELSYPGSEKLGYQLGWIYKAEEKIEANFNLFEVDSLFTNLLQIRFLAGNKFSLKANHSIRQAVVNESFLKISRFDEPESIIGETIHAFEDKIKIVGVVNDFNYQDFQQSVKPLVLIPFSFESSGEKKMLIGLNNVQDLKSVERAYSKLVPMEEFEYSFLDERVKKMFEQEQTTAQVTQMFSLLAIILSGIGLYSLSNLTLMQRTKEVGIRKILGITQGSLAILLSKEFLVLFLISLSFSLPIAWSGSQRWLANYAFRTDINMQTMILTGIVILTILIMGILTNLIRSIKVNPVDLLKNE
jgi:ABC-type antimicrobial peptide transport system permease subunit